MHLILWKPIAKIKRVNKSSRNFRRQFSNEVHMGVVKLTFKVKIKALIELKCSIVVLPVFCEEVQEPLLR